MLATALAVCACQQGRRVRFTTLAGLANERQEAESRRELEQRCERLQAVGDPGIVHRQEFPRATAPVAGRDARRYPNA